MKKTLIFIIAIIAQLGVFGEIEVPHITVYGTAETKVVPDELHWSLSVKTMGSVVSDIAQNHLEEVEAVIKYLRDSGVPEEDIKTAYMQLNENWVYRNQSRIQEGYYAFTAISFKTMEFESYLGHWTKLSGYKNLTINGVQYGVSNRIELQNETRKEAVLAAKAKAAVLAETVGVTLVEPIVVEELSSGIDRSAMSLNTVFELSPFSVDDEGEGGISPGQESITVKMMVVYRIARK